MSYIRYNANPGKLEVGDCVVRAISTALEMDWYEVHDDLCDLSRDMYDMPSSNRVWKTYLKQMGLEEYLIDTECPNCLTVKKFCEKHSEGRYILSTCDFSSANRLIVAGTHVISVIQGDYYDIFDSGTDVPLSYFLC